MARINLLPWRAERRKQRQKEFFGLVGLGLLIAAGLLLLVHSHIASLMDYQNERNQFLQTEVQALDDKIKEIQDLEAKKKRLIAKMEIIQQLQSSRPEAVHLFDELARTIPEGVHLIDLAQSDRSVTVNGIAQSNARVSAYMRNLESSLWFKDAVLNIVETRQEARDAKKDRGSRFTLQVNQSAEKSEAQGKNRS